MKVAMLEKFHLRCGGGGNQDPGDPGVGKVRGKGFFFFQAGGGGNWHWMTLCMFSWFMNLIDLRGEYVARVLLTWYEIDLSLISYN